MQRNRGAAKQRHKVMMTAWGEGVMWPFREPLYRSQNPRFATPERIKERERRYKRAPNCHDCGKIKRYCEGIPRAISEIAQKTKGGMERKMTR